MAARLKAYDFAMAIRAFPRKLARSLPKSESAKTLVESAANKRYLCKVDDCDSVAMQERYPARRARFFFCAGWRTRL